MFDGEFASVIAIFAGIAALIAYIYERAKRRIKTNTPPIRLKKMSGNDASQAQGSELAEWNFPQPAYDSMEPSPATPAPVFTPTPVTTPGSAQAYTGAVSAGSSYQSLTNPPQTQPNWRTTKSSRTPYPRLGTRVQLRESIVTMTILGPCRALAPFQDRE